MKQNTLYDFGNGFMVGETENAIVSYTSEFIFVINKTTLEVERVNRPRANKQVDPYTKRSGWYSDIYGDHLCEMYRLDDSGNRVRCDQQGDVVLYLGCNLLYLCPQCAIESGSRPALKKDFDEWYRNLTNNGQLVTSLME